MQKCKAIAKNYPIAIMISSTIYLKGDIFMSVKEITKENFADEVMNSDIPVLIDFWATWCGPCRMFGPIVEEFANENSNVKVGKINIDEQPDLASQYGVVSIPTVIVFKNGEEANRKVGLVPKEALYSLV